ncbi:MAG: hypothetical protein NVS1B4_15700 [Gemmatimonadaceae bacterium]
MHADWAIADEAAFREALLTAALVAETHQSLVTVGVIPSRPDPGFGYIQPGAEVGSGARRVTRFVEKPDRATAERLSARGYLWNSGIFVWRVGDFLKEVRSHTPEVAPALAAEEFGPAPDIKRFFGAVTPVSIDVGVLERSQRVLVVAGKFGWDDVGTWGALRRVRSTDGAGNATSGDVHVLDAADNVVHAEGNTVVLFGVKDLVVVTRGQLTLVTTVERSADLKVLIESLPPELREMA